MLTTRRRNKGHGDEGLEAEELYMLDVDDDDKANADDEDKCEPETQSRARGTRRIRRARRLRNELMRWK